MLEIRGQERGRGKGKSIAKLLLIFKRKSVTTLYHVPSGPVIYLVACEIRILKRLNIGDSRGRFVPRFSRSNGSAHFIVPHQADPDLTRKEIGDEREA